MSENQESNVDKDVIVAHAEKQELKKGKQKTPPTDLRRKLQAVAIIVGHNLLMVGTISYFSNGIDWLWKNFNIFEAGVIAIQVSVVIWLMLPTTSWRVRPVALYLAVGIVYVSIFFVLLYVFFAPFVQIFFLRFR